MGRRTAPCRAARPLAAILAGAVLLSAAPLSEPATPTRALVVVKTLVIDGLGTRTVDTDSARVPFGSRGLLVKNVPYAGPPLAFRLAVLAGAPQEGGMPLTLTAEVWAGSVAAIPGPDQISRREEATVVAPETSYFIEIDHDPKTDRRIVLSVASRPIGEDEMVPPLPLQAGAPVQFLVEVTREAAGETSPPDVHVLNSMVGRPVTYSSGVRMPDPSGAGQVIGLSVTVTAEKAQGDLVTVKVELGGSEFVDDARARIEPIRRTEVQTVSSGTRLEVRVTVPDPGPSPPRGGEAGAAPGLRPVTYRVAVTPTLG